MSCTHSHHGNDLYYVSSNILHVYADQSEQKPRLAHTHSQHGNDLHYVSGTITHVQPDQLGQNPCLAHIQIMVMICTMCLVP